MSNIAYILSYVKHILQNVAYRFSDVREITGKITPGLTFFLISAVFFKQVAPKSDFFLIIAVFFCRNHLRNTLEITYFFFSAVFHYGKWQ